MDLRARHGHVLDVGGLRTGIVGCRVSRHVDDDERLTRSARSVSECRISQRDRLLMAFASRPHDVSIRTVSRSVVDADAVEQVSLNGALGKMEVDLSRTDCAPECRGVSGAHPCRLVGLSGTALYDIRHAVGVVGGIRIEG